MNHAQLANVDFSLIWRSEQAGHIDRLFVPGIDVRGDYFPGRMGEGLGQLQPGELFSETFPAGELVEPFESSSLREIPLGGFNRDYNTLNLIPQKGRFYPQAVVAGLAGNMPGEMCPFRVIGVGDDSLKIDLNHPLASYPLTLEARLVERFSVPDREAGACRVLAGMLTGGGPGMQARNGQGLVYEFPLGRADENEDGLFYAMPRMVNHIDDKAVEVLRSIYNRHVSAGSSVLDLMASPGAGKTSTILATIAALRDRYNIAVIEGDIASKVDAEKISAKSNNGVLEVTIGKQEQVQPRKISVDS